MNDVAMHIIDEVPDTGQLAVFFLGNFDSKVLANFDDEIEKIHAVESDLGRDRQVVVQLQMGNVVAEYPLENLQQFATDFHTTLICNFYIHEILGYIQWFVWNGP